MKIFIATLITETNTQAVVPTGRVDFESSNFYRRDAGKQGPRGFGAELRRLAEADGHEVVESVSAYAEPAGLTQGAAYELYRQWIVEDLKAAMPVQAVALMLHGAMVADGYEDCEGDLIARVREVVGPDVPIGVELDLHCHFTETMRTQADIVICFKEYPHTDPIDRLQELYTLLTRLQRKEIRPVTAVEDCRMIGIWHTTREPMASFVKRMQSFEGKDGILSVSFGHGFPWGDVPDCGSRVWVVADGDKARAEALAKQLAREIWDQRDQTQIPPTSLADTLVQVAAESATKFVLADIADNPGGGAMSDSNFILQGLLEKGIGNVAIGSYWDPGALALCQSAGVGAKFTLRLGGKCGPLSGTPIDLPVTVKGIVEKHEQRLLKSTAEMGVGIWVQADNDIDIVITSVRSQPIHPSLFEGLGIPLAQRRIIVVKSTQHFHHFFAPLVDKVIYVGAPGTVAQTFSEMHYTRRNNNFWPRVANPWTV